MIILKIDVTKIDKSKLFRGKKGIYLDLVVMENREPDQYGNDYLVVQSVTIEERDRGVKGNILGNGKNIGVKPKAQTQDAQRPSQTRQKDHDGDDIPF